MLSDSRPRPAAAILAGIRSASAPGVVVTMAEGSDQPTGIEELAQLDDGGAVVAVAQSTPANSVPPTAQDWREVRQASGSGRSE